MILPQPLFPATNPSMIPSNHERLPFSFPPPSFFFSPRSFAFLPHGSRRHVLKCPRSFLITYRVLERSVPSFFFPPLHLLPSSSSPFWTPIAEELLEAGRILFFSRENVVLSFLLFDFPLLPFAFLDSALYIAHPFLVFQVSSFPPWRYLCGVHCMGFDQCFCKRCFWFFLLSDLSPLSLPYCSNQTPLDPNFSLFMSGLSRTTPPPMPLPSLSSTSWIRGKIREDERLLVRTP